MVQDTMVLRRDRAPSTHSIDSGDQSKTVSLGSGSAAGASAQPSPYGGSNSIGTTTTASTSTDDGASKAGEEAAALNSCGSSAACESCTQMAPSRKMEASSAQHSRAATIAATNSRDHEISSGQSEESSDAPSREPMGETPPSPQRDQNETVDNVRFEVWNTDEVDNGSDGRSSNLPQLPPSAPSSLSSPVTQSERGTGSSARRDRRRKRLSPTSRRFETKPEHDAVIPPPFPMPNIMDSPGASSILDDAEIGGTDQCESLVGSDSNAKQHAAASQTLRRNSWESADTGTTAAAAIAAPGVNFLDGAPPMPISLGLQSSSGMRLTPRRSGKKELQDSDHYEHTYTRNMEPIFELTRSMSDGSAPIEGAHDRGACFPQIYHDAMDSTSDIRHWVKCEGIAAPVDAPLPACCENAKITALFGGCLGLESTDSDPTISPTSNPPTRFVSHEQTASPPSRSPSQVASSPGSHGSGHRMEHKRTISLGMMMWLEDVQRQHQIKQQNRGRMVAAMAKAARAHSQLVSVESDSVPNADDDMNLSSKSFDFDDLGQVGGFSAPRRTNVYRGRASRRESSSNKYRGHSRRQVFHESSQSWRSTKKSSFSAQHLQYNSDDSDTELTHDLMAERALAQKARQMREEIRNSEMAELAREAERAAEAGEEKFVGSASTFDVVLAASAATSKHVDGEDTAMIESDGTTEKRPWERMFDSKAKPRRPTLFVNQISNLLEAPSSPMKEWVKTSSSSPPSSPVSDWMTTAMALYDPGTPVQGENIEKNSSHSPPFLSRGSISESILRQSNSVESLYTTTPLRRGATSRTTETLTTSSRLMSALATPLSERKRLVKVPVLQLRNIEDIVPTFGEIHFRLRTDMAGKGVKKDILGGQFGDRTRDMTGDQRSAIGSEESGSSFKNRIASSIGNLLKSATFSGSKRSMSLRRTPSDADHSSVQNDTQSSVATNRRAPASRPPICRSSSNETSSTMQMTRLAGISNFDCTRSMRIADEADARDALRQQLGDSTDSEADDSSTGSHGSDSTTDVYFSNLTSEIHTPQTAAKKQKQFAESSSSKEIDLLGEDFLLPQSRASNPGIMGSNNAPGNFVVEEIADISLSASALSINTPRGGAKTFKRLASSSGLVEDSVGVLAINTPAGGKKVFSRTDDGKIVEATRTDSLRSSPNNADVLSMPDLRYSGSRSHDEFDSMSGGPKSLASVTSRVSDSVSESRPVAVTAMELMSKRQQNLKRFVDRQSISRKGQEGEIRYAASKDSFDGLLYWDSDVDSEGSLCSTASGVALQLSTMRNNELNGFSLGIDSSELNGNCHRTSNEFPLYSSIYTHLGFRGQEREQDRSIAQ